ncbi:MAG: hypothetical protein WDM77_19540 [Steroidobacteraceae bacterium]
MPAEAVRPTGPAATEASAPSVNCPLAMRSMLRLVVNTSTTSVEVTPHWKPKLPAGQIDEDRIAEMAIGISCHQHHPLPRRPPKKNAILVTSGTTAMP